jgi:hypothetical protein
MRNAVKIHDRWQCGGFPDDQADRNSHTSEIAINGVMSGKGSARCRG